MAATKMTRKGQVTIPAEIRQQLDLHEGDHFVVDAVDGKVIFESQRDIVRRSSGVFVRYAKNGPLLTDEDMDEIVAQAMVDEFFDGKKDQ